MKNISTTTNSNESFAIKIKRFSVIFIMMLFLLSGIPVCAVPAEPIDNEAILELIPDGLTRGFIGFILETYDENKNLSPKEFKEKLLEAHLIPDSMGYIEEDGMVLYDVYREYYPYPVTVSFGEVTKIEYEHYIFILTPDKKIITFSEEDFFSLYSIEQFLGSILVKDWNISDLGSIASRLFFKIFNSNFNDLTIQELTENILYNGYSQVTLDKDNAKITNGSPPIFVKFYQDDGKTIELSHKNTTIKVKLAKDQSIKFPDNNFGMNINNQLFDITVDMTDTAPDKKLLDFNLVDRTNDTSFKAYFEWRNLIARVNSDICFYGRQISQSIEESSELILDRVKGKSIINDDYVKIELSCINEPFDTSFEMKKDGNNLLTTYRLKYKHDVVRTMLSYLFHVQSDDDLLPAASLLLNELANGKRFGQEDLDQLLSDRYPGKYIVDGEIIYDKDDVNDNNPDFFRVFISPNGYSLSKRNNMINITPDGTIFIHTMRGVRTNQVDLLPGIKSEIMHANIAQKLYEGMYLLNIDAATRNKIMNEYRKKWNDNLKAEFLKAEEAPPIDYSSVPAAEIPVYDYDSDEVSSPDFSENGVTATFGLAGVKVIDGYGNELNVFASDIEIRTNMARIPERQETSNILPEDTKEDANVNEPDSTSADTQVYKTETDKKEESVKKGSVLPYIATSAMLIAGVGLFSYFKFIKKS